MKFLPVALFAIVLVFSATAQADKAAGQSAYTAKGCIGCHGAGGKSVVPTYPSLKGQSAGFVRKNLADYRSGARKNPTMNAMAAGLSDSDIKNIADYIGSLK